MNTAKTTYEQVLLDRKHEEAERKRIRRKSLLYTLMVYVLLALGFIMIKFGQADPPLPGDTSEGAMGIMLGNQDEGMGDQIADVAPGDPGAAASQPIPLETAPPDLEPTTPDAIAAQDYDQDAPSIDQPTQTKPHKQSQTQPQPQAQQQPAKPSPPQKYTGPSFEGGTGEGGNNGMTPGGTAPSDGTGNKPGDMGRRDGDRDGGGGDGTGKGFSLGGRGIVDKPDKLNRTFTRQGKVVITIYVDRAGKVIRTDPAPGPGTTIYDEATIEMIRSWAMRWKFTPVSSGPEQQKGSVEYVIHF